MSDKIFMKEITLPIVETGENETYSFVQTDADLDTAGDAADAKAVGDEISALKQDLQEFPNGNYQNMTAGNAEQLVSTVFVEDEVPYNFRTSGGSADIGDREYDEIVGVSMPINQVLISANEWVAENGVTLTTNDNEAIFTSSTKGNGIKRAFNILFPNHVYFMGYSACAASNTSVRMLAGGVSGMILDIDAISTYSRREIVRKASANISSAVAYIFPKNTDGENVQIKAKDPVLFDLTLMLGTTIADYVYGLETATAGSGVSWLKHHFPKIFDAGYIPYNAGEMQSVSGLSAHRMTGFNQCDEEWEPGGISETNGSKTSNYSYKRSVNYCKCVGGATYFGHSANGAQLVVYWYDANKTYVGFNVITNTTVVAPANAAYFLARVLVDFFPLVVGDICINLHWDGERDGEYEAYKEYVYPLDDSVVLRGKLELDSDNKLRANGDRYLPDGTVDRRYTEITVAESNIESVSTSSTGIKYATINISTSGADTGRIVNSKGYKPHSLGAPSESGCIRTVANSIYVYDNALTDLATAKSILTGMVVVYEKTTATTESASPYQTPQIVDDWGTEEYVSTSLVPVGHYTKYAPNLRAKLEMAPESPAGNGDYIVHQTNGENTYVSLGSTTTIQGILDRLTALENA